VDKQARLELIRSRAKNPIPLSEEAAQTLETIRREDSDLGGIAPCGEVLAPDNVKTNVVEMDVDESEVNVTLISPLMREACAC